MHYRRNSNKFFDVNHPTVKTFQSIFEDIEQILSQTPTTSCNVYLQLIYSQTTIFSSYNLEQ